MSPACIKCGKTLTVPESIIRGMGPVCYGKSYTYRYLLNKGQSREEILKYEEENPEAFMEKVQEAIKEYKQKHKRPPKRRTHVHARKIRYYKKTKEQRSLEYFMTPRSKKSVEKEISDLKDQLAEITYSLASCRGNIETDKALALMDKIRELERK